MLQRIWRCTISPERSSEYEEFAREFSLPMFRDQPGFRGCVMSRVGGDCEVLTLWDDEASIEALQISASYLSTVAKIRAAGFVQEEHGSSVSPVHLAAFA